MSAPGPVRFFTLSGWHLVALALVAVLGAGFGAEAQPSSAPSRADRPAPGAAGTALPVTAAEPTLENLREARNQVKAHPDDVKAHYQLAELLRKSGRGREAAQEYLETTQLDPTMYVAFHQLALLDADNAQLDEAIDRLSRLRETKPRELMLHIALSELLEKRGNYYQAAHVLIDISYLNAVPPKHKPRVEARIHYLLTQAKESQLHQTADTAASDELDIAPAPLPESSLRKGLSTAKTRESRELKGVGNVPLLP